MNVGYYKGAAEVEDAMAVVAKWISANRDIKVIYHKGTAVDVDIEKGVVRIPRMACASGVTENALMLVRGQVYHEAGHIGETKGVSRSEYPKGVLFSIWNAIEDRSMESRVSEKYAGAGPTFSWMMDFYNKEIAGKADKDKAPLWEALVAMSFQSEGKAPMWKLSEKAQMYFDKGYDKFNEWHGCADARATLELAKELHELLKDASEDFNKQKEEQNQGGGQGEGQEGEGEEGQEKKQSKGKEKSEKGDSGLSKEGEDEKETEEEDEEGSGSGSGSGDFEDKDEEDEEGSGDGDEGDEGKEGEGTSDGAEGSDGDGDAEGESEGAEGGSKGGKADSKAGESEEGKHDKGNGEVKPGDVGYDPQDEEAQGGKGSKISTLEEELDGISQQQIVGETLEKIFGEMETRDMYFSRRDLDVHKVVESDDEDKVSFKTAREEMGVGVASMMGALQQALRAMSRVRKNPYQRQGRIDRKRLVAISQGLSKEVFFKKVDGKDLDVAVEIVVDESGSMSGACSEVSKLAVALGECLKAIGVPFEITGSTTMFGQGDHNMPEMGDMDRVNPIIYKHYKTFSEDWGAVRQRVVNMSAHQHNVDGEVVEYAAFRLAQRRERRKVVFSLSDGEPCAGHMNDMNMAKNLKRVCEKARKAGIEVYGFGVGTYGPQSLYGKKNFMFLEKADSMGPDFVKDFAVKITEGAVRV